MGKQALADRRGPGDDAGSLLEQVRAAAGGDVLVACDGRGIRVAVYRRGHAERVGWSTHSLDAALRRALRRLRADMTSVP